ncbi:hypothetical protein COU60_03795 [Candidatus Pacearchaeota archaeon CG10_big_fil_rev_8_21_14_0_10_34_76]|nr:MAG: hypothetical protein COU60_03795 [Candidatus Pacearchaeota archaeon CG10_big_fil_rev_8_21_14_0_10_34_76]
MGKDEEINKFVKAIEQSFEGLNPKTNWPLNGAQIDSYFDIDEGLDMYYRIKKLRETKTTKEISDMLPAPDVIRIFLQHNAIIGLKVAKKLRIDEISTEDRTDYTLFLFDILREKVKGDIFCLDGKNSLLDKEEVKEILNSTKWDLIEDMQDKRKISFLTVMGNNVVYTTLFDTYMTGGFYLHGPYDASEKFGTGAILVVRDYHDLCPKTLWPDLEMPYKKLKILAIYKNLDLKINFVNHPITKDSIGDKLIAYKIYLDDKEITLNKIDELTELFHKVSSTQTKRVNAWNDLDKVRMGAKIAFYLFKDFREKMGDNWIPENEIEHTIEKFGDEFIKESAFKENEIPDLEHWKRIFDPRDDYF